MNVVRLRTISQFNRISSASIAGNSSLNRLHITPPATTIRAFSSSKSDDDGTSDGVTINDQDIYIDHPTDPISRVISRFKTSLTLTLDAYNSNRSGRVSEHPDHCYKSLSALSRFHQEGRCKLFPSIHERTLFQIVKNEALKELIRRKVRLRQGYVGVFVKKDDE
jgi:hypothetical protein